MVFSSLEIPVSLIKYSFAFALGAFLYTVIEILWRGYTHVSMTITGGVCLALLYMWNAYLTDTHLLVKCVIGAVTITAVEFLVGCTVNLWLGLSVWDYSAMPFNLMGQVCLGYSAMWFGLCIPAFFICELIRRYDEFT